MNLQRLYIDSPRFVKKTAGLFFGLIPRNILFGKKYRKVRNDVEKYQYASDDELHAISVSRLRDILQYSYCNVPYYKELFDKYSINLASKDIVSDFKNIPFLDKIAVRNNFEYLQSTSFDPSKRSYATTGGTSGQPLGFYIDKERSVIEWAFLTAMWARFGYTTNDKRLVLRGEVIKNKRNQLWFYDPLLKQLSLSTFHMSEDNLHLYTKLINDFRPDVIHGYPSAIIAYAQFVRKYNVVLNVRLKAIVGISENIIPAQRQYIEDTFHTRMFSFYGHSEKLILAGECERSACYHIEPLYGYTEIIDSNGDPVTTDGQSGELVGTGFINHAMPFIRYKTGDIVEYSSKRCECGRNYQLMKSVKGRWLQEMMLTKKDSLISITALNVHSTIFDKVDTFQFEQKLPGQVVLNIVRKAAYESRDSENILRELNAKLDGQIDLTLEFVDNLPKTSTGKSIFLNQHLDLVNYFPA